MSGTMGDDPAHEPFVLPDRWVHADKAPSWGELSNAAIAFVGWRLDRWASLECLHALDRATRAIDGAALVLGLHDQPAAGSPSAERVRDVLLARGTWAPSGLARQPLEDVIGDPGSVLLLDADGNQRSFDHQASITAITSALSEACPPGEVAWGPRGDAPGPWPLAFPSDVAVSGSRVAVADTGHNRVVVARPGGEITQIVGDGVPDARDGTLERARFEAPRGVCWVDDALLVADTGNDALRSVRFSQEEVSTLAQAQQGSLPAGLCEGPGGSVVVALPGVGQLARLEGGSLSPIEVSEAEAVVHPVDVARRGNDVLVADSNEPSVSCLTEEGSLESWWEGAPLVDPRGLLATEAGALVADPGAGAVLQLGKDAGQRPQQLFGSEVGLQAPGALDRDAENLLLADGGGHHLWQADPSGESSPVRVRLTDRPLALAEHIRLDPIEMAPEGTLTLSISYLMREHEGASTSSEPQPPSARGPVRGLSDIPTPEVREDRIRVELEGQVAASGNLRIHWSLTGGAFGHEAAWDLPIVVRPGADERLRLALSTSSP